MHRRRFLEILGASALAGRAGFAAESPIKPPRVRPGDAVGLVNPATAAFEHEPIEIMAEALESLGLRVRLGEHYYERHGYFAGGDEARAADIDRFFADPEVTLIVARGGWGSARLLPLVDFEAMRRHPKVLLGYSDVTALLLGVHARAGLVTFHGPSPLERLSADYFRRVVMEGEAVSFSNPNEPPEDTIVPTKDRIRTITGGRIRGPILGGNLTVLTAIMGSPYLPDFRGSLLFLEDVNEAVYRVDRMLTELKLAGVLDQIAGFVFGRCTDCDPGEGYGSLTLEQVLEEHVLPLGIPAFSGALIGHIDRQFTLPLGIETEIDANAGTIRLLEPGVR